ncbi:hypothetical protein PHMEG_0002548 [Phytophthora megakarya]|uniref:Uncharacterized protein n=1 Tax=Phytophthora megakarya TaxID=4795 RepID=A0A225WYF8_9STRA|nr:hypothetical protein PHMEG_0002548 [Phytophthora megakarya]
MGERTVENNGDIEMLVQIIFSSKLLKRIGQLNEPLMFRDAENPIKEEWREWEQNAQTLEPQPLQCSFILEPMIIGFTGYKFRRGIRSVFKLWYWIIISLGTIFQKDDANNVRLRKLFMKVTLDCTRRYKEIGSDQVNYRKLRRQQHDRISLWLTFTRPRNVEALSSVMMQSQVAREVSLGDMTDVNGSITWWKWLTYALFFRRARTCLSFESIPLTTCSIKNMSTEDIEAFSRVLVSKHSKEELFKSTCDLVDEQDATLKANTAVRWEFDERNEPVLNSQVVAFPSATSHARTFNDNGESECVNAIIPGYGRCQVQRGNLVFQESRNQRSFSPLESLKLGFGGFDVPVPNSAGMDMDVNMVLERYPNLQTLFLRSYQIHPKFNFAEYQASRPPTPRISFISDSIFALTQELSNTDSEFTKCMERLEIRQHIDSDDQIQRLNNECMAILRMLEKIIGWNICCYCTPGSTIDRTQSILSDIPTRKRHTSQLQRHILDFDLDNMTGKFGIVGNGFFKYFFLYEVIFYTSMK